MTDRPDAILFGQDVQDPLGGVFRLTQGLSTRFPHRVINSPLAEATILGVGCGTASVGRLTIAEIQFIDFIAPGLNQLVTNIATQFWRTDGIWKCPLVIYAPADGYCPGEGIWHSQVNASVLARNSGITVAMPSNPVDAWQMFVAAAQRTSPTVILLPKAQLWSPFRTDQLHKLIERNPAGTSVRVVTEGKDVTVVAWGNGVVLAERAIEGVRASVELIDLRYLNSLDLLSIYDSVRKTERLLVIDQEHDGASIGNLIAAKVSMENPAAYIQTLHRRMQYLGCSKTHEEAALIVELDIAEAVRSLCDRK